MVALECGPLVVFSPLERPGAIVRCLALGRLVAEDPYPHHEGAQGLPDGPGGFRGDPAAGAGGEDEAQGEGPQGLGKEGVL